MNHTPDVKAMKRFDENSDISTTYLGKIENNRDKLKAEESFPILENGYTLGRLLDDTKCQLLLDTGASKSFMSKSLTCDANLFTLYQSLHQPHKEYKLDMVNVLACYL